MNNYVVAPESYETDQPIFGVKLMLLDSKDFAENPPDWYKRKLPERLELV